jgi:hypothetical protein
MSLNLPLAQGTGRVAAAIASLCALACALRILSERTKPDACSAKANTTILRRHVRNIVDRPRVWSQRIVYGQRLGDWSPRLRIDACTSRSCSPIIELSCPSTEEEPFHPWLWSLRTRDAGFDLSLLCESRSFWAICQRTHPASLAQRPPLCRLFRRVDSVPEHLTGSESGPGYLLDLPPSYWLVQEQSPRGGGVVFTSIERGESIVAPYPHDDLSLLPDVRSDGLIVVDAIEERVDEYVGPSLNRSWGLVEGQRIGPNESLHRLSADKVFAFVSDPPLQASSSLLGETSMSGRRIGIFGLPGYRATVGPLNNTRSGAFSICAARDEHGALVASPGDLDATRTVDGWDLVFLRTWPAPNSE